MPTRRSKFPHIPRAHVDPLTCVDDVMRVVELAITRPLQAETIVVFLDGARRGCGIAVVAGTTAPDAVMGVAEVVAEAAQQAPDVDGIVLVSVRPGGAMSLPDAARAGELGLLVADHGIELVDWIVLGRHGPEAPRDLVGAADPWGS